MFCLHKWEKIYKKKADTFLGSPTFRSKLEFRRCKKCNRYEELIDGGLVDMDYWKELPIDKVVILEGLLYIEDVNKKLYVRY